MNDMDNRTKALWNRVPFTKLLGFEFISCEKGYVELKMPMKKSCYSNMALRMVEQSPHLQILPWETLPERLLEISSPLNSRSTICVPPSESTFLHAHQSSMPERELLSYNARSSQLKTERKNSAHWPRARWRHPMQRSPRCPVCLTFVLAQSATQP